MEPKGEMTPSEKIDQSERLFREAELQESRDGDTQGYRWEKDNSADIEEKRSEALGLQKEAVAEAEDELRAHNDSASVDISDDEKPQAA